MVEKETNITVVVRVRPRNSKEQKENSHSIISTHSKELTVKATSDVSKTYTFDKVFGPESDQATVYSEVVSSMLQEVLLGYNCTILAYGQTGTGKTYTMEGDLVNIQGINAGIIPRTLYSLFEILNSETSEFNVRVSFLELYNEELKDLLSPQDDVRKLRVYEDLNRKGSVVIQGLEEVIVKNVADVISILKKGSNKKQIASTKMNEVSSRSHCIFSITVHIKETTPEGEELLKVGKLNLVDLAGSENIGRSGAENKRAKEAGMINQSLLTLGRVINALVEHSPHIPYREGKLTRLLQDSLGGKTKTCLIAAVSPARCNLEESLSTLDYAHRAKNIRNRPEVNQKMTKRTLIKEYTTEIEKLKADLVATREKNGIFLSAENYKNLLEENIENQNRIEEFSKSIIVKEEHISSLELKFQECMDMLNSTSSQLDETTNELVEKREELIQTMSDLKDFEKKLNEQKVLTSAHKTTENNLHDIASDLVIKLKHSVNDLNGLYEKLDRKQTIESENFEHFSKFQESLSEKFNHFSSHINSFSDASQQDSNYILNNVNDFKNLQLETIHENDQKVSSDLESLSSNINQMKKINGEKSVELFENLNSIKLELLKTAEQLHECGKNEDNRINNLVQKFTNEINNRQEHILQTSQLFDSSVATIINEVSIYFQNQMSRQSLIYRQREKNLNTELENLRAQNSNLSQKLEKEVLASEKDKNELLSSISQLVCNYGSERQTRLSNMMQDVQKDVECRISETERIITEESNAFTTYTEDATHFMQSHQDSTNSIKDFIKSNLEESIDHASLINKEFQSMQSLHISNFNKDVDSTKGSLETLQNTVSKVDEKLKADSEIHLNSLKDHCSSLDQFGKQMVNCFENERNMVYEFSSEISQKVQINLNNQQNFKNDFSESVSKNIDYLQEWQLSRDTSTGKTPKRKEYKFPTSWKLTADHEKILQELYFEKSGSECTDLKMEKEIVSVEELEIPCNEDSVTACENLPLIDEGKVSKLPRRGARRRVFNESN